VQSPDIRKGFIYERVPHVTLESIANNPDIREGMTREEIDAAIARHAKTETLYDKPFDDPKRVRVTGPFTVESLSPHRTISVEDKKDLAEKPNEDGFVVKMLAGGDFANLILDNLRAAGVQNTIKQERLKFDRIDVFPGQWINAEGHYTEKGKEEEPSPQPSPGGRGRQRRAAICIGPEHGTVGPQLIKEAAKEALDGVGFDLLIVCGFAFDPLVSEEAKKYGRLTVLPTRINNDLAMGEALKKTASANLFMVFGEPDIDIRRVPPSPSGMLPSPSGRGAGDEGASTRRAGVSKEPSPSPLPGGEGSEGQIIVEIRGLDVYDPTTGEIRSGVATDPTSGKVVHDSRDDVACWFIDTNYNGESFFIRHAYFTGADQPYDKLKRALKAEVDESAWNALYSTVSRPFDPPATGKIAIKVINHFGDEVLKEYEIK